MYQNSTTRTDKILNSRTAKDSQGLVRTCQVLDQSLQVPLLALQVLTSPGESWRYAAQDWNTEKIQNQFRAYKGQIGAKYSWNNCNWVREEVFFSMLPYENREKKSLSNNHKMISKILVFY